MKFSMNCLKNKKSSKKRKKQRLERKKPLYHLGLWFVMICGFIYEILEVI